MAKVVLVCSDESERTLLQACLKGHDVAGAKNYKDAAKVLTQSKPDMAVIRVDTKDPTGMELLRLMKRNQIAVPTIVVLPRTGSPLEHEAWQLGVRTFVSLPFRYDDVRKAIEKIHKESQQSDEAGPPPITDEERNANLSVLVNELHRDMKCPAGTNRVLIRSVVKGIDNKSQPRICIRCPIRQAVGLNEYVYYEHIRAHCTGQPKTCDAVIQYKKLRQAKG